MLVNWYSAIGTGKGYSGSSERIVIELDKLADVRLISFNPFKHRNLTKDGLKIKEKEFRMGEVGICYGFPTAFSSIMNKVKIGFTMWETDKIPVKDVFWGGGDAINIINQLDRLFVPCEFNKELFEEAGVKIPIDVVNLGYQQEEYSLLDRPKRKTFTFLMLGTLTQRKNVGSVTSAFLSLFKGNMDVRLILKTQGGTLIHIEWPDDKNITRIDRLSTKKEMIEYFREADCFVLPSKGEGFGLPILEAMATGLPCIFPNHSGMADIANKEYNYPLEKYETVPANKGMTKSNTNVGNWFEPDFNELKAKMLYVYQHKEEAKQRGLRAAEWVREHFTYKHTAQRIINILEDNYGGLN
jgi:glycosyltransferase involved in cell wall biosynthesis